MDSLSFTYSLPLLLFELFFLYLAIVHKNAFEKLWQLEGYHVKASAPASDWLDRLRIEPSLYAEGIQVLQVFQ